MDELTQERFGRGIPYGELHARPPRRADPTLEQVSRRRVELCGTEDLSVLSAGGGQELPRRARLLAVLRGWKT